MEMRVCSWCGPCKMLSPLLEKLTVAKNTQTVKTGSGRALDLVTINTDEQGELAMQYQVRLWIQYTLHRSLTIFNLISR